MKKHCQVWFVRHGETAWNAQGLLQGHNDIPLNEAGIQQAQRLNQSLATVPFSAVFTSDLSRAKKTAELAIHPRSIPITENPILRERFMGPFEGKSVHEFEAFYKEFLRTTNQITQSQHLSFKCHPEVESLAEVYQRVKQFIESIASHYIGRAILVVAHGGVIRSILDHFDFIPKHKWTIQNCGFIQFHVNEQELLLNHRQGIISQPIQETGDRR